jgi:hypothetical protein
MQLAMSYILKNGREKTSAADSKPSSQFRKKGLTRHFLAV